MQATDQPTPSPSGRRVRRTLLFVVAPLTGPLLVVGGIWLLGSDITEHKVPSTRTRLLQLTAEVDALGLSDADALARAVERGAADVRDAWGRPIRADIVDGRPRFVSAGDDGAFDTADDVVVRTDQPLGSGDLDRLRVR